MNRDVTPGQADKQVTGGDVLEGNVTRITFRNEENGYTVLRLHPDKPRSRSTNSAYNQDKDAVTTVVGNLPPVRPGETVRFRGTWINNKEYGEQFQATAVEYITPTTVEGIKRFLGSGVIKNVRKRTADKIVDHFGVAILGILDNAPERLSEVPGITAGRAKQIADGWVAQRNVKEIMLFLASHGVGTAHAVKIQQLYGDQAIQMVQQDPYRLARDVYGIGFKTADQIAQNMGLSEVAPQRIAAGVLHALETMAEDGHVFAERDELIRTSAEMLGLSADLCDGAIETLFTQDSIKLERIPRSALANPTEPLESENLFGIDTTQPETIEAVYLPLYYACEKGAANRIHAMIGSPVSKLRGVRSLDWDSFFTRLRSEASITLSEQQEEAVRGALSHKLSVITGGPGTGKTTTLRSVIRALEAINARYALASPTGRAAKRLSEATEREAKTIHRLFGYRPPGGFAHDENNPLPVDMLIIDETSMLGSVLFYSVLKALSPSTHLLLVGDVDQLPSVSAGDVLRDVINSGSAFVTRLNTIFRQAEGSLIIQNAHRINHGDPPDMSNSGTDFFVFSEQDSDLVADLVTDIVQNRIPRKFGFNPVDQVQVLAPMRRGSVGVDTLNTRLQAALNPQGKTAEKQLGGRVFRVGDKLMQTRNNYDKEVYNGDIGKLVSIDFDNSTFNVLIDGRSIEYDWSESDELIHAYAVTVHRSQGSEFPCVVIPLVNQHYVMLQRNLLYTAVTRAKKVVILVGSRWAISSAAANDSQTRRNSGLAWRIGGNG